MRQLAIAFVVFGVLSAACGDGAQSGTTAPPTAAAPTTSVATSTGGDPAIQACETNIGTGVPEFYATYFRCVDIEIDGDAVIISTDNLPPHFSYYYGEGSALYEVFDFGRGDEYRPNPNVIAETGFSLRIPLDPMAFGLAVDGNAVNLTAGDSTDFPMGPAGVALDGVALFNPLAQPPDLIEDERFTFDSNEGHPQQQGAYHYHAPSPGPLRVLEFLGLTAGHTPGATDVELYGVMCDGTVVLGLTELDGSPSPTNLDLQAGHVHDLVDFSGTVMLLERYHVHMAPEIGADPRGLTPEAQYYTTCDRI